MGIYSVLSILFIVLVYRIIQRGPDAVANAAAASMTAV